jgi:putative heme iron utilization protein
MGTPRGHAVTRQGGRATTSGMTSNHGSGGPPTGSEVRSPSHAERCRTLVACARSATLCTLAREPAGFPYGSLVAFAADAQGSPLLLLSAMAEHRQNLDARSEGSILVAEAHGPSEDPLALGRLTLLGRCGPVEPEAIPDARRAFLVLHPRAAGYVDFNDFAFYRLAVEAIRYIGGFGRMSWVTVDAYRAAEPDPLVDAAASIRSHMNDDHADALVACARAFASAGDATSATMTAVDRYGFEMRIETPLLPRSARLAFDTPAATGEEVRREIITLVKRARAQLG